MRHPEYQARIHAELDNVVGQDRLASIEDQSETPFTLAFIDEVHRMASHVPLAVQHWTNEDVEIGGFVVPANSIIIPNISEVHHDRDTWGDPDTFRPERFLDAEGQFSKSEKVIPYSIGTRRCPGESLAKSEIYLFLTGLLQNFAFHIPNKEKGPSLEYNFGFTLLPKAFKVDIVSRSA